MSELSAYEQGWLVGILEGEGSFGLRVIDGGRYRTPLIQMNHTDLDVIERAADLLQTKVMGPYEKPANSLGNKPFWVLQVQGDRAASWMRILYPHLSARRQAKITEILSDQIDWVGYARVWS